MSYTAPLKDMLFDIKHLAHIDQIAEVVKQLKSNPNVDTSRIAAIGYCFGGTAALELGRTGAAVNAIVCFHGVSSQPGVVVYAG